MGKLIINLSQLLSSLSLALDIAENRHFNHSRRVAYISNTIAKKMKLNNEECAKIYHASLIHDIGMGGQLSKHTIYQIHKDMDLKKEHCQVGEEIASGLPISKETIEYIKYHHEEWNGKGAYNLVRNDIPLGSQIIHIADYLDIYFGEMLKDRKYKDTIKKNLDINRNELFSAEIVDILYDIMDKDKFWFDLSFYNIKQVLTANSPRYTVTIDMKGLEKIALSFSKLIDSRSTFTARHSMGIAEITKRIVDYIGFDEIKAKKLEIAAYLHDLGKLAISNNILEKDGKLDQDEFNIIKTHPYYTKLILKQVQGLEDIAEWAGNHHEKLNGKGYPEGLGRDELALEDEIIGIADIYQALIEDRPYRKGMLHKEAKEVIDNMVKHGFVSSEVSAILDKAI